MNWEVDQITNPNIKKQIELQLKNTKQPKESKYHNKKVKVDEHIFDSNKEMERYVELGLLVKAGEITDLRLQVRYPLQADIHYVADFVYFDFKDKQYVVEDVKGMLTPVYKMKRKLFKEMYGFAIKEV